MIMGKRKMTLCGLKRFKSDWLDVVADPTFGITNKSIVYDEERKVAILKLSNEGDADNIDIDDAISKYGKSCKVMLECTASVEGEVIGTALYDVMSDGELVEVCT